MRGEEDDGNEIDYDEVGTPPPARGADQSYGTDTVSEGNTPGSQLSQPSPTTTPGRCPASVRRSRAALDTTRSTSTLLTLSAPSRCAPARPRCSRCPCQSPAPVDRRRGVGRRASVPSDSAVWNWFLRGYYGERTFEVVPCQLSPGWAGRSVLGGPGDGRGGEDDRGTPGRARGGHDGLRSARRAGRVGPQLNEPLFSLAVATGGAELVGAGCRQGQAAGFPSTGEAVDDDLAGGVGQR